MASLPSSSAATTSTSTIVVQSPSIEDLLSSRSKHATTSIYSTLSSMTNALDTAMDLSVSDAARLAMAHESANPAWSPSMSSSCDEAESSDEQADTSNSRELDSRSSEILTNAQQHGLGLDLAATTPTLSDSDYSRSPSIGSVCMAELVSHPGHAHAQYTPQPVSLASGSYAPMRSSGPDHVHSALGALEDGNNEDVRPAESSSPLVSPSKRVLNARNLVINTSRIAAARTYPHESTTPTVPLPSSARVQTPPTAASSASRSAGNRAAAQDKDDSDDDAPLASAFLASGFTQQRADIPPVQPRQPLAATVPASYNRPQTSPSTSAAMRFIKRSSTDSSLSYLSGNACAAEEDDEDLTIGPNQASLARMQSFLGPKMKHISPAPWSMAFDGASSDVQAARDSSSGDSAAIRTSDSGISWSENESEVGSVHLATKAARNRFAKDGTATGTLKGLGLAIANASAAGLASVTPSRPSLSGDRSVSAPSVKSRTATASSAMSAFSNISRGTAGFDGPGMARSQSHELFDASSLPLPLPPLPSPGSNSASIMKVTNIVRSKSPESTLVTPTASQFDITGRNTPNRTSSLGDSVPAKPAAAVTPTAAAFHALSMVTSAPEANASSPLSKAAELSSSLPESAQALEANKARRAPSLPRKRPPLYHQDSMKSNATDTTTQSVATGSVMTASTSVSSLPSPCSDPSDLATKASATSPGLKLISLQDAREREKMRNNSPSSAGKRLEQEHHVQAGLASSVSSTAASTSSAARTTKPTAPVHPLSPTYPVPPVHAPAPVPVPPFKGLKSKKSGFLKLFKMKDEAHPPLPSPTRGLADPSSALKSPTLGSRAVSGPTDLRKTDDILYIGPASPRPEAMSALPFPAPNRNGMPVEKVKHAGLPTNATSFDGPRKAGASAPPQVSLSTPSPDLSKGPSATVNGGLSVQGDFEAPSLSLRPVSMMISSMPASFLSSLAVADGSSASAKMLSKASNSTSSTSIDSNGDKISPARTPDTPSFVFFDSDNNVTPPSGHTPSTPATEHFTVASPTPTGAAKPLDTMRGFGLPTPPHSASSARTFSAAALNQFPTSPTSARDATIVIPYRARIAELEKLVQQLRAELSSKTETVAEPPALRNASSNPEMKDLGGLKKPCSSCGCTCKPAAMSVLQRPRIVGHGNMFSSGRD